MSFLAIMTLSPGGRMRWQAWLVLFLATSPLGAPSPATMGGCEVGLMRSGWGFACVSMHRQTRWEVAGWLRMVRRHKRQWVRWGRWEQNRREKVEYDSLPSAISLDHVKYHIPPSYTLQSLNSLALSCILLQLPFSCHHLPIYMYCRLLACTIVGLSYMKQYIKF